MRRLPEVAVTDHPETRPQLDRCAALVGDGRERAVRRSPLVAVQGRREQRDDLDGAQKTDFLTAILTFALVAAAMPTEPA